MSKPIVGALRATQKAMKPIRPFLKPISYITAPVAKITASFVTPVTDAVIEEVGKAIGASKESRKMVKKIAKGTINVGCSAALGDVISDPDVLDEVIEILELLNPTGTDGGYAWSPA